MAVSSLAPGTRISFSLVFTKSVRSLVVSLVTGRLTNSPTLHLYTGPIYKVIWPVCCYYWCSATFERLFVSSLTWHVILRHDSLLKALDGKVWWPVQEDGQQRKVEKVPAGLQVHPDRSGHRRDRQVVQWQLRDGEEVMDYEHWRNDCVIIDFKWNINISCCFKKSFLGLNE